MKLANQIKILVVVESIDVEDSSGSKANVALIENLHKEGFELLVLHYTRKEIFLPGIKCVAIKEKKWNYLYFLSRSQRRIQNDLKIIINKPLENTFGFSFTFFNDSKSIAESIKNCEFEPDLVLSLSKGASFRPHHALLKLPELHAKWLAYIHDPYPFHYYPEPYQWSEPGFKEKISFFSEVSSKCKWAAFPSLFLKEWMTRKYPYFEKKSIIIPHQLAKKEFSEGTLPDFFDPKKFSLLHAGNLMKQRSPLPLLISYQKFLKQNPEAAQKSQLILLGNADYYTKRLQELEDQVDSLYISDGNVKFDIVLRLQKKVSVNIILESEANDSPFLPGKFPHCLKANKTILFLGPQKSEVNRLLGVEYPFKTEANNIEKTVELLQKLYNIWLKDPVDLKLNRPDLLNYFSSNRLKDIILKMVI
ncbi:UDP-glycosyltransferase [uncultured Christiangramia sp.]|uniref:UDP-glycosyltransferase n=1 Tax=Christiangramia sp. 3-2217-3z TaxID=3417564 RepID=UPI00261F6C75|nr:UDP-glycosyltransferase [uncultured Christiangramia sp.]